MTAHIRRESHDSESNYSQSDSQSDYASGDDPTAGHQPATTSNRHPGTSEAVTEKADLLTKDDSDTDNPLEQMLLILRKTMNDEILKAAGMARSMDPLHGEVCQQSLIEALDRKEYYKNKNKKLEDEKGFWVKEVDHLEGRVKTLQARMNAARERAMGLFE